jgi:hypothetical protein
VTRPGANLDFARAFRFVPEDPNWIKKILIGGAVSLFSILIIPGIFLAGYFVRLIRRTAAGEALPLPEWEDWGGMFGEGLAAFGIYFAYVVAVLVVPVTIGCGLVFMGVSVAGLGSSSSRDVSEAMGPLVSLVIMALYGFFMLAMLALTIYLPSALTRYALTQRFGAGFEVRENIAFIRRNLGSYALALLFYLLASFAAQFGVILCCVGVFPAAFWSYCILAWGLGEVVRGDPTLPLLPSS